MLCAPSGALDPADLPTIVFWRTYIKGYFNSIKLLMQQSLLVIGYDVMNYKEIKTLARELRRPDKNRDAYLGYYAERDLSVLLKHLPKRGAVLDVEAATDG